MEKLQAKEKIQSTFENPFDKQKFTEFIRNLLNNMEDAPLTYSGQYIPEAYRHFISSMERIGKYSDGEYNIDILIIRLKRETSLERARSSQRNFVSWYLNASRPGSGQKDAALVAYVAPDESDWRFSLVKMDYKFEQTKTGKVKVKEEFTPARRWSFLVGENEKSHTAQSRLVKLLIDDENAPTLNELEHAFDIETVTKEFFLKYRELFLRTKEELDKLLEKDEKVKNEFEAKDVDTVNFAKKLLGQIVFLYFLQKKGWFGVGRDKDWGSGSKNFLRELFEKKHGSYNNFYNDILEPLFYEALRLDRSHDDHYYSRFNCKIPFLNGGLFDPIGNHNWSSTDICLTDSLFSNNNKTKEGDPGDGILDIFDRYNFTVKEDEPLEKEVAIDPELLGKAYEKFNAIRPDNYEEFKAVLKSGKKGEESKFNKKFGVYYTPREIVHYMCRQSLINYLATELEQTSNTEPEINKEDIETLIHAGEHVSQNDKTALEKEQNIIIGIQKSSKYKTLLPNSIIKNAKLIDQKLADITVCDPAVGSGAFPVGMMNEIVKLRNVLSDYINDDGNTPYEFKRRCIEHSLYGVDIDPGAIEIAKLRLWLSLIVDETDIKSIKPLPNLDYKIICGNSLLRVEKNLFNNELFAELEKLKSEFLKETSPKKKQDYKAEIDALIEQITKGHTEFDFEVYFSEVFHEKGGFDVVIANPPYVDSEMMVRSMPEFRKILANSFSTAKGNWDIYIPFWELGVKLLKNKGNSVFITPNKWLAIGYRKSLRKLLRPYVYKIGNCDEVKVFEAGNSPVIVFINKANFHSEVQVDRFESNYIINDVVVAPHNVLNEDSWGFLLSKHIDLILKLMKSPKKIKDDYYAENPFTVSEAYEVQKILYDIKDSKHFDTKMHFKFVNTGTIEKFYFLWSTEQTTYLKNKYRTPVIDRKIFKNNFPNRFNQMCKPKIVISGMRHFECALDTMGNIIAGKSTVILKGKNNADLKVILSLLNSNLIEFYIKEAFSVLGIGGGINFTANLVENLPLCEINDKQRQKLICLTDNIMEILEKSNLQKNSKEQKKIQMNKKHIDQIVYKLYNLTPPEIKIIKNSQS